MHAKTQTDIGAGRGLSFLCLHSRPLSELSHGVIFHGRDPFERTLEVENKAGNKIAGTPREIRTRTYEHATTRGMQRTHAMSHTRHKSKAKSQQVSQLNSY